MRWDLETQIRASAKKIIRQHEKYAKWCHEETVRRNRRAASSAAELKVLRPETWSLSPGFNPYLVKSNAGRIAHSISRKLKERTYQPADPATFEVPKPSGGVRIVNTFEIADEVVSRLAFVSLTKKNLAKFSQRSYAYRPDIGPHDAVEFVSRKFSQHHRLFVADYDFSQFFDSVDHEFLLGQFGRLGITSSPLEKYVTQVFLDKQPLTTTSKGEEIRRGVPQGTSLSLFLANLAAAEVDNRMESSGVSFVRYADDTLLWSSSYDRISKAVNELHEASAKIGSPINIEKSRGVRLLVHPETRKAEIACTKKIDFLGHELSLRSIRIKEEALNRIKGRVNDLIYTNLLLEPQRSNFNPDRVSSKTDRDYVVFVLQLRRYLYGSLSEKDIQKFQIGNVPAMSFEGVMSFFPLVDDDKQLRQLDEWVVRQVWLALRKRKNLLAKVHLEAPRPAGLPIEELASFTSQSARSNKPLDLRLPSFSRMAHIIRKAVQTHGLGIMDKNPQVYNYAF